MMSRNIFRIVGWGGSSRSGQAMAPREGFRAPRRQRPELFELEGRRLLATLTVSNADPSGTGSLAAAIANADSNNQANTITFKQSVFSTRQSIILGSSALELSDTGGLQTIVGPAAGVAVYGGGQSQVFQVDSGVKAALSNLTISNGSAPGSSSGGGLSNKGTTTLTDCTISGNSATGGRGGGVYNGGTGTLTLSDCTISGNSAEFGGGVDNDGTGTLILTGCTVNGNNAVHGAGLDNGSSATLTLTDCTLSGNSVNVLGGGLNNYGVATLTACTISTDQTGGLGGGLANAGTATLTDTIVANNSKPSAGSDIHNTGTLTGSYDLIGTGGAGPLTNGGDHNIVLSTLGNLGLAPLGNYGGPTETMALLPGSAALGTGTAASGVTADQRGLPLSTPHPDIGAYQSQGFTLTVDSDTTPQSATVDTGFLHALSVIVTANDPSVPLAGAVIVFSAPSSGASASLSSDEAPISPAGVAGVVATANSTAGSYTVVGSIPGTTATADFELTNQASTKPVPRMQVTPHAKFNKKHKTELEALTLAVSVFALKSGHPTHIAPTGTVSFELEGSDNQVHIIGTASLLYGRARYSLTNANSYVDDTIDFVYSGDANFQPADVSEQLTLRFLHT
jgi:hypothetical protein